MTKLKGVNQEQARGAEYAILGRFLSDEERSASLRDAKEFSLPAYVKALQQRSITDILETPAAFEQHLLRSGVDEGLVKGIEETLLHLRVQKSGEYGDSWIRRGIVGAFHNIARKWDRLEVLFEKASRGYQLDVGLLPAPGSAESLFATLGDLANYVLMVSQYWASQEGRLDFERWTESIRGSLPPDKSEDSQ